MDQALLCPSIGILRIRLQDLIKLIDNSPEVTLVEKGSAFYKDIDHLICHRVSYRICHSIGYFNAGRG
jgi:hypothetical protein